MQTKVIFALAALVLFVTAVGAQIVSTQTNTNPIPTKSPSPIPTALPTVVASPTPTNFPTPTLSPTLEPNPSRIGVTVTPWGDMYRTKPDCKSDFSVELFSPNQNASFSTGDFNVVFRAGAYFWIVEKAYYTSDLFSGERWITISKQQYTQDLQKTFTFSLSGVPQGTHFLSLTVIFHEGTRNNATSYFNVSS